MTTPYLYQVKGARRIQRFGGRALLADVMGLGKTLQSLLYAHRHPEIRPVVVVCPASLKWNWERECSRHFRMLSDVLSGTRPDRAFAPARVYPVTIINYDILGPWLGYLKSLGPKLVILDECHYLQSHTSQRTRNVRKLCEGVPHVVALSGTPLTSRPINLWPTLNILRPDLFKSRWDFGIRYCGARRTPWGGWDYSGASNLDELNGILRDKVMIRRTKEEVLDELPRQIRSVVPLGLADWKQYHQASTDTLAWVMQHAKGRLGSSLKAQAMTRLGHLTRLAGELKLPAVMQWADNYLAGGDKLVLFAVHRKVISALRDRYKGRCVVVDGSTPMKDRKGLVDRFQKSDKCRLFIGNVRAAGVGLNLTAGGAVAFAEMDWVPAVHAQAEKRIDRIGQERVTQSVYLVGRGTVEEVMARVIQRKARVVGRVLDGDVRGDLDVCDLMLRELKKGESHD